MILTEFDRKGYRKTIREESYADGEKAGREEGRAEERVNTEAERKRADEAEARIRELEAELAKCAI
ncbi:MAG: hypothetical protein II497_04660 [Lachnospiraceae bacterium]|nr:hypothetical protein [Lachnospiraceae bacterium]